MQGLGVAGVVVSWWWLTACGGSAAVDPPPSGDLQTPELIKAYAATDTKLSELDADSQETVCFALGVWQQRMRLPSCYAFIESAVVLQDRTQEEDRALCLEGVAACPFPARSVAPCTSFPAGCRVTLRELDRCLADSERWYAAVPSCENMTRETAPTQRGPSEASCAVCYASCVPTR